MPVIHEGQRFPSWSELRSFEICTLGTGEALEPTPTDDRTLIVVVSGEVHETSDPSTTHRPAGSFESDGTRVEADADSVVVILRGAWSDDRGKCGVFTPHAIANPIEGDPVDYAKTTTFDNHYHDCDEHWIIVEGSGVAVSEGIAYDVGPGDCVATQTGDHHDFPQVHEPVRAVFFETSMRGERRRGHLWEHTHGAARPERAGP